MLFFLPIYICLYFDNFARYFLNLTINLIFLLYLLLEAGEIAQGQKGIKVVNLIPLKKFSEYTAIKHLFLNIFHTRANILNLSL